MGDHVALTDLEVITRFSLAVRTASADRAEVIAALRADLAWLEGAAPPASRTPRKAAAKKTAPARATR